ncbi:methyl-accepting chemotaxis protein [Marinobacterium jannaschii]|uniref:methyl-accepting chemotaxis protein n=1 Tax=Marinobacterium jannaschii TaxID=64970 RepID=UPI00048365B0|nr:methyl-accepting chemotaxis protein [Marinobacterium jannaschii]
MSLKVTQKITLGFISMVIFILVVSAGGLVGNDSIKQRLNHVTDDALPTLVRSFNQMIELQQANQALFSVLAHDDEKIIKTERAGFENHLSTYNQNLDEVADQLDSNSELNSVVTQMRQQSSEFASAARIVMDLHSVELKLKQQVVEEEIRFQGQSDAISSWAQRYISNGQNLNGIIAARGMTRALSTHRFQLINFKRSGDIEGLKADLESTRDDLVSKYKAFVKEDKKASQIETLVSAVNDQFFGKEGLISLYIQLHDTDIKLKRQISSTHQKLEQSRAAANAFIDSAKGLAEHAKVEADEASTLSRTLVLALAAGSVIVALLVAVITINTIRRPLAQIQTLLARVQDGDLKVEFDQSRKDEFGALGASLNAVVNSLKDILQQISSGSGRLSEVAGQNAEISMQTTHSMTQQSQQLEMTASAATELESSVAEVADHSGTTLEAVHACESLSIEVNRYVEETLTSIQTQASGINQAVDVSNELAGYSTEIDAILETIHAIAEQTNLLALNAAIEAARAGDHGRGFAVVADEVRELASRTRNSTQEIQQMVENMQSSIKQVVSVMQVSYDQAEQCVGHANTSRQSLQSMNEAIANIRDLNTQIAEAAQQQSQAVEEVSRNLTTINTAAADTSSGAELAANSSNELLNFAQAQQSLLTRFSI